MHEKAMQTVEQRHKRGGLYFEDFEVGKTYEHRYTRTVTQMDCSGCRASADVE